MKSAALLCLVLIGAVAFSLDAPVAWSDPYTLTQCAVLDTELDGSHGEPVDATHEGRLLRFCCAGCAEKFAADPATYLKKVDEAIVKQQAPHYPLDTCVVGGGKLGSMGDPVEYVYNNRLVRFCCAGCKGPFKSKPTKYLEKLDAAVIEAQSKVYPIHACPISGRELDAAAVNHVIGNRLIKLCCAGCISKANADAAAILAKLDASTTETPNADKDQ